MQRKFKSVFGSSSRKNRHSADVSEPVVQSDLTYAHGDGDATDGHRRFSSDASKVNSHHHGRSRPLSSVYNGSPVSHTHSGVSEPVNDLIANDYKAYLPALSSTHDSPNQSHMTLGGDRRLITTGSDGLHEKDVADRNTARTRASIDASRRKPLPSTPGHNDLSPQQSPASPLDQAGNTRSGHHTTADRNMIDGDRHQLKHSSGNEHQRTDTPQDHGTHHSSTATKTGNREDKVVPIKSPDEIEKVTEQLLDGFVDLRNTVDTDKDVRWAPAVTHEVIKPHEHEIIQHKIFREIHNYEYHHHIQPIYDLQVLPPRHFIPDPSGDGLIEVSANQIPNYTGANRRWEIVQKHVPVSSTRAMVKYRTEPKIIQHPTTITAEGFERKETTIIYPPTLADLKDYEGLVQPVHFDHKTGRRWLGEVVTMDKVQKQIDEFRAGETMNMEGLRDALPREAATSSHAKSFQSNDIVA